MKAARYRAWHFVFPDLEDLSAAPGLVPETHPATPGLRTSPRGGIDMVEGDNSVRQAILMLLFTIPGERVMRPDYGCNLHRLIFSPNDNTTAGLAIHYIRQAIEQWEPRVDIMLLDAVRDPEAPERLNIRLVYRVRATLHVEPLTIAVGLAGERI
jgi:phage baseplate assembly protein W